MTTCIVCCVDAARCTLSEAVARLRAAGCETPKLDAEVLLAHALGVDRTQLFLRPDAQPPSSFDELVERRAAREPVAYITGRRGFRHLELEVTPDVLIPRPETEHLVEAALELPPGTRVIDVGTGSGAVALALKQEQPDLEVIGTDTSERALAVARHNAQRLNLDVEFVRGDLLCGLQADAVVSNPPYVESSAQLPPELGFEPQGALVAGADGLDVIRRLIPAALGAGARFVAIEIPPQQASAVDALFGAPTERWQDLGGRDRVVVHRC